MSSSSQTSEMPPAVGSNADWRSFPFADDQLATPGDDTDLIRSVREGAGPTPSLLGSTSAAGPRSPMSSEMSE